MLGHVEDRRTGRVAPPQGAAARDAVPIGGGLAAGEQLASPAAGCFFAGRSGRVEWEFERDLEHVHEDELALLRHELRRDRRRMHRLVAVGDRDDDPAMFGGRDAYRPEFTVGRAG
jgi:hypothetical protein